MYHFGMVVGLTLVVYMGMAGQDGIGALKALWSKFGPVGRIAHTQKAYEKYVHSDQSIGQFLVEMEQIFVWHDLGGHKLTSRRKCEMALKKIKSEYRLSRRWRIRERRIHSCSP